MDLGVRIENVWAFESDRSIYAEALRKVRRQYPALKLIHGAIENFIEINPIPFDIMYLDFTSTLISRDAKPFVTIHRIFEQQALSELSVLITNVCEPDPDDEVIDFLTDYFFAQEYVEGTVFGEKTSDGINISWFVEGRDPRGWDRRELRERISLNWKEAYSAFCTQYPIIYANLVQPAFRILRVPEAKRVLLEKDRSVIEKARLKAFDISSLIGVITDSDKIESPPKQTQDLWGPGGDFIYMPYKFPMWFFIHSLTDSPTNLAKAWIGQYRKEEKGVSRFEAVQLGDLLRNVMEGYWPILSEPLRNAIPFIMRALPDRDGGVFCDIPMPHLWVEAAMNQLGFPYHPNIGAHWRTRYRAKQRTMLLDAFVFDRCRSFYDWLTMTDLYDRDLAVIERQMLSRICFDAIRRQTLYVVPQLYEYGFLIGTGKHEWASLPNLAYRLDLPEVAGSS
jgi:hypothetical protein